MHYTEIGLYWTSSANLHPDFQNKILLRTLWFSLWDFHAPNELIQPANLSHPHLSLPPSLEWHRPWEDLEWGVQPPFIEQTGHDCTAQSKLIPPWNRPCFSKDCINQTTAQQYLRRTPEVVTGNAPATKVRPSLCHCFTFIDMFTSPIHQALANNQSAENACPWVLSLHRNPGKLTAHLLHSVSRAPRQAYSGRYTHEATYQQLSISLVSKLCNKYHLLLYTSSFSMVCSHILSHSHFPLGKIPPHVHSLKK